MAVCNKLSVNWRLLFGFMVGLAFGIVLSALLAKPWKREEKPEIGKMKTHGEYESFHEGEDIVVKELSKKIRILCLVLTFPKNHYMAHTVKVTWGSRCDVLLLMSTKENKTIPTIALPVKEGYKQLWGKVKESFRYIYKNHWNTFDWLLKVDDDTYVVMENLRYMLRGYNASEAVYFGRRLQASNKSQAFMSGGAGYVLSKEAFRRLVEEGFEKGKCKGGDQGPEDIHTAKCLELVGGKPGDSRDKLDRGRFFPLPPKDHLFPNRKEDYEWYPEINYYHDLAGIKCCTDFAITFHYLDQYDFFATEFLIYHLRPYGTTYNLTAEPNRRPENVDSTSNRAK